MNRREAIRARCLDCSGFSKADVRDCEIKTCALFPFRMGTGHQDPVARSKAIRSYCLWDMAGRQHEVAACQDAGCVLHPFRNTVSVSKNCHRRVSLEKKISGAIQNPYRENIIREVVSI